MKAKKQKPRIPVPQKPPKVQESKKVYKRTETKKDTGKEILEGK